MSRGSAKSRAIFPFRTHTMGGLSVKRRKGGRAMPWWEQVCGDVDDLIFADEEYEISAR